MASSCVPSVISLSSISEIRLGREQLRQSVESASVSLPPPVIEIPTTFTCRTATTSCRSSHAVGIVDPPSRVPVSQGRRDPPRLPRVRVRPPGGWGRATGPAHLFIRSGSIRESHRALRRLLDTSVPSGSSGDQSSFWLIGRLRSLVDHAPIVGCWRRTSTNRVPSRPPRTRNHGIGYAAGVE